MILPAFGKILVLVDIFSIQILIKKVLKNQFFSSWQNLLVLANVFFLFKFKLKQYWKNSFCQLLARSWFWRTRFSTKNKKTLKNWFFQLLARSWFWRMFCFYTNSTLKSIEKLIFSAFGKILVFANAFFYSNSNYNKELKNWFFSFWQPFGFGECIFSIHILIKKNFKIWFFQLLAKSWFWWIFFYSNSNLKNFEKLIFSAFGKILVLAKKNLFKFEVKKYWKIDVFSFWQDLGFGECFFLFKF